MRGRGGEEVRGRQKKTGMRQPVTGTIARLHDCTIQNQQLLATEASAKVASNHQTFSLPVKFHRSPNFISE